MPLNINSGSVTPQQAQSSVSNKDSIKDSLDTGKIGDNQVLYSKGDGTIRGNKFHSWFKNDADWKAEKENAKNDVVDWIKGFGLSKNQTDALVSDVESKFASKGELRGSDLKEIAKLAQKQLEPFAAEPFVCKSNASAQDISKANLWLALNKGKGVGAKGSYQNGFTMARNANPSLQDVMNVPHALFSMTPLAGKADVRQQQMLRMLSQMPPVPKHEIKSDSNVPNIGGTGKNVQTVNDDLPEVGSDEWQMNQPSGTGVDDNMKDFTSQDGFEDYAQRMEVKNSHMNLGINNQMDDADLLQLLDDELGDEVDQLDINSDYLNSLRDMMYEDFSEIEYDYGTQLGGDNQKYVSPMKVFTDPAVIEDDFDSWLND